MPVPEPGELLVQPGVGTGHHVEPPLRQAGVVVVAPELRVLDVEWAGSEEPCDEVRRRDARQLVELPARRTEGEAAQDVSPECVVVGHGSQPARPIMKPW